MEKIFKNLLSAIGIMIYFIILNFAYSRMDLQRLIQDIEVFAGAFLVAGICFLEKGYKTDDTKKALNGIEFIVLSLHSLSIMHVITLFKYDFMLYLLSSSYVIAIYYVLKSIVIYTKDRKEHLRELSDISEIVKEDKPVKKEAKKRKIRQEEKIIDDEEDKIKKTTQIEKNNLNKTKKSNKKSISKEEKIAETKSKKEKESVAKSKKKPVSKEEKTEEVQNKKETNVKKTTQAKKKSEIDNNKKKNEKTKTTKTTKKEVD